MNDVSAPGVTLGRAKRRGAQAATVPYASGEAAPADGAPVPRAGEEDAQEEQNDATTTSHSPGNRGTLKCEVPGCTRKVQTRKRCWSHGGGTRCSVEGCDRRVQAEGKCCQHLDKHCAADGCANYARRGAFCLKHNSAGSVKRNVYSCVVEGCPRQVQSRGLCYTHGGGLRCSVEGCMKGTQVAGMCARHSAVKRPRKRCVVDGCNKQAQYTDCCSSHGGGKRCAVAGCNKHATIGPNCRAHGGGQRPVALCSAEGCTAHAVTRGKCWKHGGGNRCRMDGCDRCAPAKGLCPMHMREQDPEAAKREMELANEKRKKRTCMVEGCQRQKVTKGLCWSHGGGKRCRVDGCLKSTRGESGGLCSKHNEELQQSGGIPASMQQMSTPTAHATTTDATATVRTKATKAPKAPTPPTPAETMENVTSTLPIQANATEGPAGAVHNQDKTTKSVVNTPQTQAKASEVAASTPKPIKSTRTAEQLAQAEEGVRVAREALRKMQASHALWMKQYERQTNDVASWVDSDIVASETASDFQLLLRELEPTKHGLDKASRSLTEAQQQLANALMQLNLARLASAAGKQLTSIGGAVGFVAVGATADQATAVSPSTPNASTKESDSATSPPLSPREMRARRRHGDDDDASEADDENSQPPPTKSRRRTSTGTIQALAIAKRATAKGGTEASSSNGNSSAAPRRTRTSREVNL